MGDELDKAFPLSRNETRHVNAQIGWAMLILFILVRLLNAQIELALLIVGVWFLTPGLLAFRRVDSKETARER